MDIEHSMICHNLELVTVNGTRAYLVDRVHEVLRNIHNPSEVLTLEQRQYGRTPSGDLEVLELYQNEHDETLRAIVDSSPSWLDELQSRAAQHWDQNQPSLTARHSEVSS